MNKVLSIIKDLNPFSNKKVDNKIINTVLIFIFGIVLGMFSKWLDNLAIDSNIWWMNIIDKFDLNNQPMLPETKAILFNIFIKDISDKSNCSNILFKPLSIFLTFINLASL